MASTTRPAYAKRVRHDLPSGHTQIWQDPKHRVFLMTLAREVAEGEVVENCGLWTVTYSTEAAKVAA